MAGDPHDRSTTYPRAARDSIKPTPALPHVQGILHNKEGDIRSFVVDRSVADARRQLVTTLAYLDVADIAHDELRKSIAEVRNSLARIEARMREQRETMDRIVGVVDLGGASANRVPRRPGG